MLDLNEIAVFTTVASKKSLTAAGRALGLPKSTISRKLAALEERIGTRLLERKPKHVRLTEAGTLLYDRCAGVVASVNDAIADVAHHSSEPRGLLRVSVGIDIGVSVFGPLVQDFLHQHPEVSVDLNLTDRPVDVIAEGFDLAVRIGDVRDPNLIVKRLGRGHGVVCASPSYLAQRGEPEDLADLARHTCIVFSAPPHGAAWRFNGPAGEQTVQLKPRLLVNSLAIARNAAVAGLGIARLPRYVCEPDLAEGRLRRVLVPFTNDVRPINAVLPSNRHMSAKVKAFLEFLTVRFSQVPTLGGSEVTVRKPRA